MKNKIAIASMLLLAACANAPAPGGVVANQGIVADVDPLDALRAQRSLDLIAYYLVGTWDTIPQREGFGDSTPMRLRIARLWPERADKHWLYLEYVNPADERQVFRQRILQFVSEGSKVHALMYRLPGNPLSYAGEWRKAHPFESVKPETLREAEGCRSVWMSQLDTIFAAGTEGTTCRGDRPEALNEHSEFYLGSSTMRAWISGLDASGNQVEGLTLPSEFRKISPNLI